MCHLGMRWDAPAVVDLCIDRLKSSGHLEVLTAAEINCLLHLESRHDKIRDLCAAWLLRYYADVAKVITDE